MKHRWSSIMAGLPLAGLVLVGAASAAPVDDPAYHYKPNSYCGSCHKEQLRDYSRSMMGKTPHDQVFQQFYLGLDAKGRKDGMGYKALHPDEPGDCANCHTPDMVLNAGHEVDLMDAIAAGSQGISCDFCHTVTDVKVIRDPKTGRYQTAITRVVRRARGDTKGGPYRDAVSPAHKTAYSPIHTRSEFCAMCHLNQEHLLSLSTYADWKQAYDKGVVKRQCQDCHMPTGGKDRPVALGGPVRKAATIHRHLFHGGHFADQVKKAATLGVAGRIQGKQLLVDVRVTNSGAGHTMPDGATLRNILLVVEAYDDAGRPLRHTGGPRETLPPLAGRGKGPRDLAGHPGKMFARPFVTRKGTVPAGGFNADHVLFDTRIRPRETDHSVYHFAAPRSGHARVVVRLVYRWTYKPMADRKGWRLDDLPMARREIEVR